MQKENMILFLSGVMAILGVLILLIRSATNGVIILCTAAILLGIHCILDSIKLKRSKK